MNQPPNHSSDEPIIETVAEPLHHLLKQNTNEPSPPERAVAEPEPEFAKVEVLPNPKPASNRSPNQAVDVFRPQSRQPLAALTVLDDGLKDEGELIRIRADRFLIGREQGDLTIPFDSDISAKHAGLECHVENGRFRWHLKDHGSTNGTFVRAYRGSLFRDTELILGGRRYLFQLPDENEDLAETVGLGTQVYQTPGKSLIEMATPKLIDLGSASSQQNSHSIERDGTRVGVDPSCEISIEADRFLNPVHCRFYRDQKGRWMIEDLKSTNGVWIRVNKMPLTGQAEFQLGQQRFRFVPEMGVKYVKRK